jgi:hypothetical protein
MKGNRMHWHEIFLVGSLWFWLLLAVEMLLLIVLLEWDRGLLATLSLAGTLLALQFLGDVNIYGYVIEHPFTLAAGVLAYFALGTLWAVGKWWFYVREQRACYDELRSAYVRVHGVEAADGMPAHLQEEWSRCIEAARKNYRPLDVHPLAARHKRQIVAWMAYWPWSATWTLLKDPVRKAFQSIYHHVQGHLQEISDRAFKGIDADLPAAKEPAAARAVDPTLVEYGVDHVVYRQPGNAA